MCEGEHIASSFWVATTNRTSRHVVTLPGPCALRPRERTCSAHKLADLLFVLLLLYLFEQCVARASQRVPALACLTESCPRSSLIAATRCQQHPHLRRPRVTAGTLHPLCAPHHATSFVVNTLWHEAACVRGRSVWSCRFPRPSRGLREARTGPHPLEDSLRNHRVREDCGNGMAAVNLGAACSVYSLV